ncbi:polysaccharide deacetylase [Paenibacillus glucanolyticus]
MGKKQNTALNVRRKNRGKIIKVTAQILILGVVAIMLANAIFDFRAYKEPDKSAWRQEQGFIALSYFGVGRTGTSKLVSKSQLDAQLKALHDQGYVTISQQDIIDYYAEGKKLPDKALYLSFEDGRNDSALFAQPLLEKYNYKATFLSYANKMGNSERKFLQPRDMLKMTSTGFWELGTNGNRLTYINIFDKEGRYIGVKDESELTSKASVEYYNHYLMDFIRDENMIPLENRVEMEERVRADYEVMNKVYTEALGYVPGTYMIMHANALGSGMNQLVANANTDQIQQLFGMNFNREGNAFNTKDTDLYNLTRVQPAPYWSTNHLVMKLRKDQGQPMQFVRGDKRQADKWELLGGAAEFQDNRMVVTSPPSQAGGVYLKGSEASDVTVSAKALGNVVGRQSVYVRYDRMKGSYLRLLLENNNVAVEQKIAGQPPETLFTYSLPKVGWGEEDLQFDKASVYTKEQTQSGARDDENDYPVNIGGSRVLEISVDGNSLSLSVDQQLILDQQPVHASIGAGGVAFESQFHEQNEKDDIYDAIFEDVRILSESSDRDQKLLFTNKPTGFTGMVTSVQRTVNRAVDWAVETF